MRIHFADFVILYPQRVETRIASTHFRNGLKPIAPKSVMATPFVRGYGPTASGGLTGEGKTSTRERGTQNVRADS